jgi:transcriptional regulator GlxA family with amidase domain
MSYRILREELRKDRNGKDEVFLQIEIDNDGDVFTKAEWMSPSDTAAYLINANHVNTVAARMETSGIARRTKELADAEIERTLEVELLKLQTAQALLAAEIEKNKSLS